jgi:hypothetical protein
MELSIMIGCLGFLMKIAIFSCIKIDIHSTTMSCKTESLSPFRVCISPMVSDLMKLSGSHRLHAICIGTQEKDTQYMGSISHEICVGPRKIVAVIWETFTWAPHNRVV